MPRIRHVVGALHLRLQDIHKELEKVIADYFGTEDTILYAACFDANGGVFEPLFFGGGRHHLRFAEPCSIIDGVRLCKAVRYATPMPTWANWRSA